MMFVKHCPKRVEILKPDAIICIPFKIGVAHLTYGKICLVVHARVPLYTETIRWPHLIKVSHICRDNEGGEHLEVIKYYIDIYTHTHTHIQMYADLVISLELDKSVLT